MSSRPLARIRRRVNSNSDNHRRAAEFLREWQEQMTKQMTSPDAIRAMLEAMQQFGKPPHDANARRPANAPDARDDAIGDIAKRLDAVERELRRLHARLDAAEKPARTGKRADATAVAKRKPAVGKSKRTNAQRVSAKRKPGRKK